MARPRKRRILVAVCVMLIVTSGTIQADAAPVTGTRQPLDSHGNPVARPVAQPRYPVSRPVVAPLPKGQRQSAGTTLRQAREQAMEWQGADAARRGKPSPGTSAEGKPLPTAGGHDHAAMMAAAGALEEVAAPAAIRGPTDLPNDVGGRWSLGPTLPSPSIHTALLNTGKLLIIAGSQNQWDKFTAGTFTSVLWDPRTNTFKNIATPHDMFCAGHVILRDGRVLVSGGTTGYPAYDASGNLTRNWLGSKKSYVFDPIKEIYEPTDDLNVARWYPTLVRMGNDQVVAVAGLDDTNPTAGGVDTPVNEIFTPNAGSTWDHWSGGSWDVLNNRPFPQYAHLILAQNGELLYTGQSTANSGDQPGLWQPFTNTFRQVSGLPYLWQRNAGGSVLLPPAQDQKVMVMGGGDWALQSLNDTHIVDLKQANPAYADGPPILNPKMYVGAITLPDYTVLQTNGALQFREIAVKDAQIYHPDTNQWVTMNSPSIDRLYHSEAILLPDGRVATLGSQVISGENELRMELFEPPYLFKGQRPTVGSGPTWIDYDTANHPTWAVTTDGAAIARVSLLRPSATTHSTDTEQRLVDLPFTYQNGAVRTSIPTNRNLLPPGWYMLTVVDDQGRPSVAKWVSLN